MKMTFVLLALLAMVPSASFAQGKSLDEEVNAELDRMYQEQPATQSARAGGANVQVNVGQAVDQKATTVVTQKQPVTIIEATPLAESRADKLRKNRQDQEVQTEQKIVEKLELSRLEDEKRRSEVLFGDRFNTMMNSQQTQAVAPAVIGDNNSVAVTTQAVQAPVAVAAPIAVIPEPKKAEVDREAIRSEVTAALSDLQPKEEEKPKSTSYIGALVGSSDYPDAANVHGQYSLGVQYGKKFDDRVVVEGSYMYSNFNVEQRDGGCFYDTYTGQTDCYPRITEMNQHNFSVMAKYQLLKGMFRPELGILGSYNYRTFTDTQFALSDSSVTSQALDIGGMVGASLELSPSFSLGFDFRMMRNVSSKQDSQLQKSYSQPYMRDKPVEKLSYYTMGLVLRSTF